MKGKTIGIMMLAAALTVMSWGCASLQKDGVRALENGEYEEALEQFETLVQSGDSEEAADGYLGLGMTYYEMKDYENALNAFMQAIDNGAQPGVQTYNLMGICSMQTGSYTSALEYIQSGIALTHTSDGAEKADEELVREMKFNEIICYERQADWDNARQKTAEYLAEYPDDEAVQKEAEFLETR